MTSGSTRAARGHHRGVPHPALPSRWSSAGAPTPAGTAPIRDGPAEGDLARAAPQVREARPPLGRPEPALLLGARQLGQALGPVQVGLRRRQAGFLPGQPGGPERCARAHRIDLAGPLERPLALRAQALQPLLAAATGFPPQAASRSAACPRSGGLRAFRARGLFCPLCVAWPPALLPSAAAPLHPAAPRLVAPVPPARASNHHPLHDSPSLILLDPVPGRVCIRGGPWRRVLMRRGRSSEAPLRQRSGGGPRWARRSAGATSDRRTRPAAARRETAPTRRTPAG